VAQDEDLEVVGGVAAGQQDEQANRSPQGQVGKSWQHRGAFRG
jgi:hypothetical protein